MIVTNPSAIFTTLKMLEQLDCNSFIPFESNDVLRLFKDSTTIKMIHVAGNSLKDATDALDVDIQKAGSFRSKFVAVFVCTAFTLDNRAALSLYNKDVQVFKQFIISDPDQPFNYQFFYFYE